MDLINYSLATQGDWHPTTIYNTQTQHNLIEWLVALASALLLVMRQYIMASTEWAEYLINANSLLMKLAARSSAYGKQCRVFEMKYS